MQRKSYLTISLACFAIAITAILFMGCAGQEIRKQVISDHFYDEIDCWNYAEIVGSVYEHIYGKDAIVCTEKKYPSELGHVQAGFMKDGKLKWLRLYLKRSGINPPGWLDKKNVPCELKTIYECMTLDEFKKRGRWRLN